MKKILRFLEDLIEVYLPMLLFSAMFVIFIIGIVFRYLIRQPLTWSNEFISICFLEMVLLASCYVQRLDKHVKFSMILDIMPPKVQGVIGCIGNTVLLVCFIYVAAPSLEYILFLNGMSATPVFHIGLHIIYFPFMLFLLLNAIYCIRNIYREAMCVLGKNDLHKPAAFDAEGGSEQ